MHAYDKKKSDNGALKTLVIAAVSAILIYLTLAWFLKLPPFKKAGSANPQPAKTSSGTFAAMLAPGAASAAAPSVTSEAKMALPPRRDLSSPKVAVGKSSALRF